MAPPLPDKHFMEISGPTDCIFILSGNIFMTARNSTTACNYNEMGGTQV